MLFFLVTTSLHAVPDDVLVPTYAREGGGSGTTRTRNILRRIPYLPVPTLQEHLASITPSEQKKVLQLATREALDTAILYLSAENFRRFMILLD